MYKLFTIILIIILTPRLAHSLTDNDVLSIACSESSNKYGFIGPQIKEELSLISKNPNRTHESTSISVNAIVKKLKDMEAEIYNKTSLDREELFRRFGTMLAVDLYIIISSGTPTRSYIAASKNPDLTPYQLISEINSECISGIMESRKNIINNRR